MRGHAVFVFAEAAGIVVDAQRAVRAGIQHPADMRLRQAARGLPWLRDERASHQRHVAQHELARIGLRIPGGVLPLLLFLLLFFLLHGHRRPRGISGLLAETGCDTLAHLLGGADQHFADDERAIGRDVPLVLHPVGTQVIQAQQILQGARAHPCGIRRPIDAPHRLQVGLVADEECAGFRALVLGDEHPRRIDPHAAIAVLRRFEFLLLYRAAVGHLAIRTGFCLPPRGLAAAEPGRQSGLAAYPGLSITRRQRSQVRRRQRAPQGRGGGLGAAWRREPAVRRGAVQRCSGWKRTGPER